MTPSKAVRAPLAQAGRRRLSGALVAGAAAAGLLTLPGCGLPLFDRETYADPVYTVPPARIRPAAASSAFAKEVARAVSQDPLLAAGDARVRGSSAELDGVRAAAMPQLSIGVDFAATLLGVATGTRYLPVFQVSQLLFDGGQTRARVNSARLDVVGEVLARDTLAAQVTLNAVEAWIELAHQRLLFDLAQRNLTVHQRFIRDLNERVRAGAGVEGDVELARGRTANAATRLATIQGERERAEANYERIFGKLPPRLPPAIVAPPLPRASDADLIATSPRLRGLDVAIEASAAALAAAQAAGWPSITIGLRGQYDLDVGRGTLEGFTGPRYDVFTGGQRGAAVALAAARKDALVAERRELGMQIAQTLAILRSDARTGRARLEISRSAVAANEAGVVSAQQRFTIGRATILQLLDAQRDLFQAQEAAAIAERDLVLSGYAALALTGDIVDAFGITLPRLPGIDAAPAVATTQASSQPAARVSATAAVVAPQATSAVPPSQAPIAPAPPIPPPPPPPVLLPPAPPAPPAMPPVAQQASPAPEALPAVPSLANAPIRLRPPGPEPAPVSQPLTTAAPWFLPPTGVPWLPPPTRAVPPPPRRSFFQRLLP